MPSRRAGESRKSFVNRCIPIVLKDGTAKDQSQAAAICYSLARKGRKKKKAMNMEAIIINADARLVREELFEGEMHWVVPMVMMTEDVHNGSLGPILYERDELIKWTPSWNYKPIVLNHPDKGSACEPDFLSKNKLGVVLHSKWDGRQTAEGYFNQRRVRDREPRIAQMIMDKRMIELSTGLGIDLSNKEGGEFKGTQWRAKAINHRPDHLAILPDHVGACSIEKGCGCVRNKETDSADVKNEQVENELSHEEVRDGLREALREVYDQQMQDMPALGCPWVSAVFDDYCIFYWAGKMYQTGYQKSDDEVSLVGDPTEVVQRVEYVPVGNSSGEQQEDNSMAKKDLIEKIIKNTERTNFEESDRKYLEGLKDDRLEKIAKLVDNTEKPKEPGKFLPTTQEELDAAVKKGLDEAIAKDAKNIKEKAEAKIKEEEVKNAKKDPPPAPPAKPLTAEEYLASMPPELRPVWNAAQQALGARIGSLVETVIANSKNTFTKEELLKMAQSDMPMLEKLAKMSVSDAPPNSQLTLANYFGMGAAPIQTANSSKQEALPLPVYNAQGFKEGSERIAGSNKS